MKTNDWHFLNLFTWLLYIYLVCHIREVHCDRIFRCHLCPKTFKAAVALKVCFYIDDMTIILIYFLQLSINPVLFQFYSNTHHKFQFRITLQRIPVKNCTNVHFVLKLLFGGRTCTVIEKRRIQNWWRR